MSQVAHYFSFNNQNVSARLGCWEPHNEELHVIYSSPTLVWSN